MRTRLMSPNTGIALSVITLVTGLGLLILVAAYVPEFDSFIPMNQPGNTALSMLLVMGTFGAWIWALLAGVRGSRLGLIVAVIFNLLLSLGWSLQVVLVLCPTPCSIVWPIEDGIAWSNLIIGVVASIVLGLQLRKLPK